MVEPDKPRCKIHASAKELWGRNLDGVDSDATKAAMDQNVAANKEEAESLLQMGTRVPKTLTKIKETRVPKTLTEIKEIRRKLAVDLKRNHPQVYINDAKTHLPATPMPESDFTSAAAAKKIGVKNPCGAAAKRWTPSSNHWRRPTKFAVRSSRSRPRNRTTPLTSSWQPSMGVPRPGSW